MKNWPRLMEGGTSSFCTTFNHTQSCDVCGCDVSDKDECLCQTCKQAVKDAKEQMKRVKSPG